MADCIFCTLAGGEGRATYVHRDERAVAIEDLNPVSPTHVLVIPKEHVESVHTVTDPALVGHLVDVARGIAEARGLGAGGYRLVFNTGPDGGQTVPHLHLHLLGGRRFTWPPG